MISTDFDLLVIGGGIMGCAAAIRAAEGGMKVTLLEKAEVGSGASGVNAGTLSLQIKRIRLMPYALRGHDIWAAAGERVGYREVGGLTLAFSDAEAERLTANMTLKREAGAPISFLRPAEVREMAPALSDKVLLASYCHADGYSNSSLTGSYYRKLLQAAGVDLRERREVLAIDGAGSGGYLIRTSAGTLTARRILLACGGWTGPAVAMLGVHLPIQVRINTVSVTERAKPIVKQVIGHASGLLTLKQKDNGTVLIGGGWQGRGTPAEGRGEVVAQSLITNLQLAQFALPALARVRLMRSWTGFEANVPDFYPLAGALPGFDDVFVLACVRGGYTIGPYIGQLMGDRLLDREPELPLFDPGRIFDPVASHGPTAIVPGLPAFPPSAT